MIWISFSPTLNLFHILSFTWKNLGSLSWLTSLKDKTALEEERGCALTCRLHIKVMSIIYSIILLLWNWRSTQHFLLAHFIGNRILNYPLSSLFHVCIIQFYTFSGGTTIQEIFYSLNVFSKVSHTKFRCSSNLTYHIGFITASKYIKLEIEIIEQYIIAVFHSATGWANVIYLSWCIKM